MVRLILTLITNEASKLLDKEFIISKLDFTVVKEYF